MHGQLDSAGPWALCSVKQIVAVDCSIRSSAFALSNFFFFKKLAARKGLNLAVQSGTNLMKNANKDSAQCWLLSEGRQDRMEDT